MRHRWVLVATALSVGLTACVRERCFDTCNGCCNANDECFAGRTLSACGTNGEQCVSCAEDQACNRGVCGAPIVVDGGLDAGKTCHCPNGCCGPDFSCNPGNTPLACGSKGAACATCSTTERCGPEAVCIPATCSGCIDAMGACRTTMSSAVCGLPGQLCVSCLVDESCTNGRCVVRACNAATCGSGCCSAGSCIDPPSRDFCGIAGSTCIACGLDAGCANGLCR